MYPYMKSVVIIEAPHAVYQCNWYQNNNYSLSLHYFRIFQLIKIWIPTNLLSNKMGTDEEVASTLNINKLMTDENESVTR